MYPCQRLLNEIVEDHLYFLFSRNSIYTREKSNFFFFLLSLFTAAAYLIKIIMRFSILTSTLIFIVLIAFTFVNAESYVRTYYSFNNIASILIHVFL